MPRIVAARFLRMSEDRQRRADVDRFILDRIESVPHLEALLLLWRDRARNWSAESLSERLWVTADAAKDILMDLARDRLITAVPGSDLYQYQSDPDMDRLLDSLSASYRQDLIGISTMIHSKGSSAVREFARAFRLKKEQE